MYYEECERSGRGLFWIAILEFAENTEGKPVLE